MYIISPYLRFTQTPSGYMMIFNFLLDKLQDLSTEMLPILKFCVKERTEHDILAQFGNKQLLDRMIANYQIVSSETIWRENFCNILEIETSTLCSWKCEYCPVRSHARPVKFIDPVLFSLILNRAEDYGGFKQISLTSYNEASLDDNFIWYIQEIRKHGFDLLLYSNGSYLTQDKLNAVQAMKEHAKICFNLPSLNRARFEYMTGSKTYDSSIAAIDAAIDKGIRVTIIVQGDNETRELEQNRIQRRFPKAYVATYASNNRGAAVFNSYIEKIKIPDQRLTGCYMVTRHVCLTVDGDMMLCCNDFYHANLFGNIKEASFKSLLTSEKAVAARKATWGGCQPGEGHLCRVCTLMQESMTQDRFVAIDKIKITDITKNMRNKVQSI